MTKVARRYPRAAAVEVWNEPNEWYYWQSGADPARYTQLLRTAYAAVRSASRSMPVVTGGLSDRWVSAPGSRSRASFLSAMYSEGAAGNFDALGVHVYPGRDPWQVRAPVQETRELSHALSGRTPQIWVTEVGFSTTGEDRVSPQDQATLLTSAVRIFRALDVRATIVHTLVDAGTDPDDRESGFGVLTRAFQPKPAYCAFGVSYAPAAACR